MARSPRKRLANGASKPLLLVLRGERIDPPPMWLMRQAGRYLPEYRKLREEKGSFLGLVCDSDAAADVTLQPLEVIPLFVALGLALSLVWGLSVLVLNWPQAQEATR